MGEKFPAPSSVFLYKFPQYRPGCQASSRIFPFEPVTSRLQRKQRNLPGCGGSAIPELRQSLPHFHGDHLHHPSLESYKYSIRKMLGWHHHCHKSTTFIPCLGLKDPPPKFPIAPEGLASASFKNSLILIPCWREAGATSLASRNSTEDDHGTVFP